MVLSTKHTDELVTVWQRGGEVQKPKIISDYNKCKAFIDLSDQMKAYSSSFVCWAADGYGIGECISDLLHFPTEALDTTTPADEPPVQPLYFVHHNLALLVE